MKISVEDISIKTASIEVKVLTLSRKQVTMAVFRQLDTIFCIDMDDFRIRGKIWGRVNYHHKCVENQKHMHLVCELNKEIYHGIIYEELEHQCVYYKIDTERIYGIREYFTEDELEEMEVNNNKWRKLCNEWDGVYFSIKKSTDHLFIAV